MMWKLNDLNIPNVMKNNNKLWFNLCHIEAYILEHNLDCFKYYNYDDVADKMCIHDYVYRKSIVVSYLAAYNALFVYDNSDIGIYIETCYWDMFRINDKCDICLA